MVKIGDMTQVFASKSLTKYTKYNRNMGCINIYT